MNFNRNEGEASSAIPSPIHHQHRAQQYGNQSPSLLIENESLRGELIELRRKISWLEDIQRKQEQLLHHRRISNAGHTGRQEDNAATKQKYDVVLELPVIVGSPSCTDHHSDSTTDERETEEPSIDIESHQSAAGLHHRTPHFAEYSISNTTNTASTASTQKTRRTELLTDDDCSSTGCYEEDDPLAEARGLIVGDSLHRRHRKQNREKDGVIPNRLVESFTDGEEISPKHYQMTFWQSLTDRAGWLIGLLIFQSLSSFILARNESLLQEHTVIVQFLTMLVGAGGNAGNQASVGVVRGIAVGSINQSNARRVLSREFATGVALSVILGLAGFVRAKVFAVPWMETFAITTSLFLIVIISVAVGATLPLGMEKVGIDPAHSSTTIQVIMDITGVVITVHVSSLMLNSDFHDWITEKLSFDGGL